MPLSAKKTYGPAWAYFGIFAVWGTTGLLWGLTPESAQTAEASPAEIVASRFPPEWNKAQEWNKAPAPVGPVELAAAPAPRSVAPALAAKTDVNKTDANKTDPKKPDAGKPDASKTDKDPIRNLLFSPQPTYALASASLEAIQLPERALGYADPAGDGTAVPRRVVEPAERTASVGHPAEKRPAPTPRSAAQNNGVLNGAQIASIKERLKLTPDQEQYWPAVEQALQAIAFHHSRDKTTNLKSLDPNSAEVQTLVSAAIPLIMRLREEQKREVRTLARLMGLENVASQI
jgi:hypothetical protein